MERNSLITLIPKERKKEYKKNSLRLLNFDGAEHKIQSDIHNLLKKNNFLNQDKENLKILQILKSSYKKLLNEEDISQEDFILQGHELLEYQRIDENKKLRYLVYRYRYRAYPSKVQMSSYPPCVQIEPCSLCNYRCS